MKEDFELIRQQISVADVAGFLLGTPSKNGMYCFPGERTASIKIYPQTETFCDFGRPYVGKADIFGLWQHITRCSTVWEARNGIIAAFGLEDNRTSENREAVRTKIKAQEKQRQFERSVQKQIKRHRNMAIAQRQAQLETIERLLQSEHIDPFCDFRQVLYMRQATLNMELDVLCDIA